jgi:hypothetical protein
VFHSSVSQQPVRGNLLPFRKTFIEKKVFLELVGKGNSKDKNSERERTTTIAQIILKFASFLNYYTSLALSEKGKTQIKVA